MAGGGDWYRVQSVCWVTSARGVSRFAGEGGAKGEAGSAEKSRLLLALGRSKLAPLTICTLSISGCCTSSLISLVGGLGNGMEIEGAGADVAMGGRSGRSIIERVKFAVVGKAWDETGMRGRTPS